MNDQKPKTKRLRASSSEPDLNNSSMLNMSELEEDMGASALSKVLSEINSLKKGQIEVKEFLDARIDKLAQDIKMDINNAIDIKLQKFKTEMDMHIHEIGTRIDFLEQKVSSLEANTTSTQPENQNNPLKNNELCILARGIPYRDHENLNDIVGNLINEIKPVGQVEVTAAERLKARNKDQTPLLKIAFADIDQKNCCASSQTKSCK